MKTLKGITLAVFFMFAASCEKFEDGMENTSAHKVFHASFETVGTTDTKTYLDSEHKLLWTADDRLSIFEGNTYNQQYRYKGQTGESSADFEKVPSNSRSIEGISANYAVYPYLESTEINNSEKLAVTLPSVQQYAAGSFGLGANTMVAVTNGTSDTFLAFKNLCGYLVIKLYGEGTVKSIAFKGNNGEDIAGIATVTASYDSEPNIAMASSAAEEITLDCGSGVVLGSTSQTATEFWFCIPPVTFSKGFSIKVTNTSGWAMERSISSSRTITRNIINSMSALEVEFTEPAIPVPEMVDLGLSVKWASFNIGAGSPEEYGDYYAWGAVEPLYEYGYAQQNPQNHWKADKADGYNWKNAPYQTVDTQSWSATRWTKYLGSAGSPFKDKSADDADALKTVLDSGDDVAQVKLGDPWRMPTKDELNELWEECIWTWTDVKGVCGYKVSGKKRGFTQNSIFLPAAGYREDTGLYNIGTDGYYWSSSLEAGDPVNASQLYFFTGTMATDIYVRSCGQSVRAVAE